MTRIEVRVPDLGEFDEVDVVEVLVSEGDEIQQDEALITLESDKASMDIPAPQAGVVVVLSVAIGAKVGAGDLIALLEVAEERPIEKADEPEPEPEPAPAPVPGPDSAARASVQAPAVPSSHDYDTDVLVLGSGPGGYAAAFRAADLGRNVTLVERYPSLGGVCLNVGCIPSKALLHMAKVMGEARDLGDHGVVYAPPRLDLDKIRTWKQEIVARLSNGLSQMAEKRGVSVVHGRGRFVSAHALEVERQEETLEISFASAVIAAGSRATPLPGLPEEDRVMDSTSALELADVPGRLLVIGGGIVGLEMASVYAAFGSAVTVVELLPRLMSGCDADLVRPLQRRLRKQYENIYLDTRVTTVVAEPGGLAVSFEGKKAPAVDTFDRILVAVGRRANGDNIAAAAAGIEVEESGIIRVDERQRTNVGHILAIGDITGEPMLAHRATHQGKVAAEVLSGHKTIFDARVIPAVAYTDPEVAWAGLREEEAEAQGIEVGVGRFPWLASGRSLALGRSEGFTKLIFDPDTKVLLGGGVVGPSAGDLIAEIALAIEMGADAEDLSLTVHPHPTLSETIAMASEVFLGTVTDLYLG